MSEILSGNSITLVNPAQEVYAAHPSPPVWLAYLQAVLKQNGVEVKVIDEAAGQKVKNISTDWVGVTVTTPTTKKVYSLIEKLDEKIVLGGPHVSIFPQEALQHADKVVVGEGEKSVLEIFSSNKKVLSNTLIEDIDTLPFPDWSGLPIKNYRAATRKHPYLSILTSRGCPHQCVFCYKGIFGNLFRVRSPENIVDEIEMLIDKYGIREIAIIDDSFTISKIRTKKICEEIIARGLDIKWTAPNGVRVDTVDLELLKLMRKSGCYQLAFGIESGNQQVLDMIGKRINLQQIRNAVKWAKEAGIETIGFFMIALPFDTEKTMQETIDFAKELDPTYIQFTITTPYPGTKLYDLVEKEGEFLIKDWSKYGSYSGKAYYNYGALNSELVERMYKKAFKEIYSRPGYVLKRVAKNPKLIRAGLRYGMNLFRPKKEDGKENEREQESENN